MTSRAESLKINLALKKVNGNFRVFTFEDHGHTVSYIPSLNLSSYANNKMEAIETMTNIVLKDYFENLMQYSEQEIYQELSKLGWLKNMLLKIELNNNTHIDEKGILRNFNLSEETKIEEELIET